MRTLLHTARCLTFACLIIPTFNASVASAAYSLTDIGVTQEISFSGFTAPIVWGKNPSGLGGLNSETWAFQPLSLTSAALFVTGDNYGPNDGFAFGKGVSNGGVSTPGVYAFNVGGGVTALGVQPSASIFTPGSFTLRIANNTGVAITQLDIDWDVFVRNDGGLSNSFDFYYSATNADGSYIKGDGNANGGNNSGDGTFSSTAAADPVPTWVKNEKSYTIAGLNLADGDFFYLRWGGTDAGGTGSTRDEFGLAGISLTARGAPMLPGSAHAPEAGTFFIVGGLLGIYGLLTTFRRRGIAR